MKRKWWTLALTGALALGGMTQTAEAATHKEKNAAVKITRDQAKKIALKSVKGKVTDVDLENKNNQWAYEVEIRTAKGDKEVSVDAQTGKVVSKKNNEQPAKNKMKITRDEAKKIALEHVDGKVTDIDLDRKNNQWVYEVEVITVTGEVEVYINAQTGEVSSIRPEDDKYNDDRYQDQDDDHDEEDDD
ncbi:PepSY domain-containing protein [Bacillus sp. REN10]|uniref:PepSY domain-containing protein n=1 Tax=Bacillus sp. REN10 TaxID=2782541 RepID=UPI00193B57F9|nr:PepSY domain-containing protein [Bacillus sp. REN10]